MYSDDYSTLFYKKSNDLPADLTRSSDAIVQRIEQGFPDKYPASRQLAVAKPLLCRENLPIVAKPFSIILYQHTLLRQHSSRRLPDQRNPQILKPHIIRRDIRPAHAPQS